MQHVTNRIEWQQHNSCVPLGQDSAVYFKPCGCQWQMIVMSHLSISPLSSEDGRAVKQLHFAARPEACKRGEGKKRKKRGWKQCHMCEKGEPTQRNTVTALPRSVGEPASLPFGSSTTTYRTHGRNHDRQFTFLRCSCPQTSETDPPTTELKW